MVEWENKPLGDVCEFQRGLTYGKSDEVDVSRSIVLRANNVDLATHTLDFTELRYISDAVAVPVAKKVRKGSLLICTASGSKSHLGKIAYIDDDYGYAFGGFMGQITPAPDMDGRYLFHVLTSPAYKTFIEALSDGVNINNLKFDDLRQFAVPVPPLAEQRRIAAILDEAFEAIATAKANTEKNLENARELFESRVKAAFSSPADDWVECTLGSVCEMYQPKTITGKDLVANGPYPVFGANGVIGRYTAYNHEEAEVLVTCRGATCGSINVSEPRSWVTGNAMVVRPRDGSLDKAFLEHLLRSGVDLSPAITGAAQPQITRANLSPLMISFPKSVAEQRNLTATFDELEIAIDGLQDVYSRKRSALDELKKSLLHQAFTGQLTAKSTDQQLEAVA